MHLTPYALDSLLSTPQGWQSIYILVGRIFRLGINLRFSTYKGMQLLFSIITVSDKELSWWLDVIDLLSYVIVSLVISIGQSNWLDDERSPSKMSSC